MKNTEAYKTEEAIENKAKELPDPFESPVDFAIKTGFLINEQPKSNDCNNPKKKLKARAKELKSLIHQKKREVVVLENELRLIKFDLK